MLENLVGAGKGVTILARLNEFDEFKKTFVKYQIAFGLIGYQVYFRYKPIESSFAQIKTDQESMVASVTLNSRLPADIKQFQDIRKSAKHEAIHLLIERLESLARSRYTGSLDIYEAVEELVVKLESLIPDRR